MGFFMETDGLTGEFMIFKASQRGFELPAVVCGVKSHIGATMGDSSTENSDSQKPIQDAPGVRWQS